MNRAAHPVEIATQAQNASADPRRSTFVSANAGSGKTRVLINRIARLLLDGVAPESILCLTFTKAAAGEVQQRVFDELGAWVLMNEAGLLAKLANLGERNVEPEQLKNARRLFASALETPSGLKVQTIHAFSASLLRRFPLEAGLAPDFRELDENAALDLGELALRRVITEYPDEARAIAARRNLSRDFVREILKARFDFRPDWSVEEFARALNAPAPVAPYQFFETLDAMANLETQGAFFTNLGNKTINTQGEKYVALRAQGVQDLEALKAIFFTQKGELRKALVVEGVRFQSDNPSQEQLVNFVIDAVEGIESYEYFHALKSLHQFADRLLGFYSQEKSRRLVVDYDDLIERADALLNQNDRINWVMYRLDSRISHILVDEAQDTNDAQWRIIDALAKTAADDETKPRTLFVVGDEKQSIYSFQGANPDVFARKRMDYRGILSARGEDLQEEELHVSFRSSGLVLDFVDAVFRSDFRAGLGENIAHQARSDDLPAMIEILPYQFVTDEEEKLEWPQIGARIETSDELSLAREIARKIHGEIESGILLHVDGKSRPVAAGDYLILLRKRRSFFYAVQKELQGLGVPVAGVDSLQLQDELAVRDLMALLRVLASPYDDLSLACVLRSPLAGLSEQALYELAYDRGDVSLLERLKAARAQYPRLVEEFEELQSMVDYARPYDLLLKVLHDFDGEAKLRGRLGVVVEDVLQSFLDAALRYESEEAPSLAGFIAWFERQDMRIKRALDEGGTAVRTMTIHGAKGLEAPIVVLPHIASQNSDKDGIVSIDGVAVTKGSFASEPAAIKARIAARKAKLEEEENRLEYVALTRAQSRLIICGAGKPASKTVAEFPAGNIYPVLMDAARQIEGEFGEDDHGIRVRRNYEMGAETPSHAKADACPREFISSLKIEPEEGAIGLSELLPDYHARGGRGAEFGTVFHALMEILTERPEAEWRARAQARHGEFAAFEEAYEEAVKVVKAHPWLASQSSLREFEFQIDLQNQKVNGRIDHIALGDELLIVDYKTNLDIAEDWEALAENYKMQLAAYWHALRSHFQGQEVRAAILWSYNQTISYAPTQGLEQALGRLHILEKNQHSSLEIKETPP